MGASLVPDSVTSDQTPVKFSERQEAALGVALSIFAYLFLQLAFGIYYWLPTHSIANALRPNVDAVFLVGLSLIAANLPFHGERAKRYLLVAVAPLITLAVLLGIAEGIARRSFAYEFTLAYHADKIKALLKMMYEAQSLVVFVLCMALLLLLILALIASATWAIRRFFQIAQEGKRQSLYLGGLVGSHALVAGLLLGITGPVTAEVGDQLSETFYREERIAQEAARITEEVLVIPPLSFAEEAKRPTVLVFVVESYGKVLFEAEKYRAFHTVIADAEKKLLASGYSIRSQTYEAPVFGGSSWLANATFLCRVVIPTEKIYLSLFKTATPCLPRPFNAGGYQTVFAGSNTIDIDDEYRALFPFEVFYTNDAFDYHGPRMSWSYMPDQYVIDQVERRILSKTSDRPRFVYYKLSSSHHPWDTIPTYIEDWSTIGDGSLYKELRPKRYKDNAFLGGQHLNEGYYDTSVYSLQTIFSYLNQLPEDREFIAVIFGDHQPRGPVAEAEEVPWTVPLHVISRDSELISRFEALGYTPGLFVPSSDAKPLGLESIASDLFAALNGLRLDPAAGREQEQDAR